MTSIATILNQNSTHAEIFKLSGKLSSKIDIPSYVVGGYVRDALLNKKTNDIDIMVEGDAIKFSKKLAKELNVKKIVEFPEFSTVLIPYSEINIQIASARKESYRKKSRKPLVEMCAIEDDLSRRDFTINSMAASLMEQNFGEIYDPFSGIKDLQKKLLITPLDPDTTFMDDPLRILRAVRFSAQLNFDLTSFIEDSIIRQKQGLEFISKERITEEIIKILKTDKPSIGFHLLKKLELLPQVFPELNTLGGIEIIDGQGHKDVFLHTLEVVDNAAAKTEKMKVRFAALLHDIAKPQTKRYYKGKGWTYYGHEDLGQHIIKKIAKRMKISNELRDYLMLLTKLHLRPIALAKEGVSDSAVRRVMLEAGEHIDDLMILCRADITTKNHKKIKEYLNNFDRVEKMIKNVTLRDEIRNFKNPITGEMIMKEFNLKPSKDVGKIKNQIKDAIIDGKIKNDCQEALDYMKKIKI